MQVGGRPENACELFQAATLSATVGDDGQPLMLEAGSVQRRKKLQTVNQFLTFCCEYEGFAERWKPPVDYTDRYLGRSDKTLSLIHI